ncbi:MAG: hypothetical protein CL916_08930 [Deltaproteobacteria bacterium]|nr:hypothetical protein [Deltaproteobacteria bacterium]
MSSIYLSALVFGGILILFSILLGGDSDKSIEADKDISFDKDFDFGDIDADVDVDADVDAEADGSMHGDVDSTWLPFLSMRFWTFGLASFGMTGTILDFLDPTSSLTLPISIVMGISIGWVIAYLFHTLKKEKVSSITSTKEMISEEGTVILPIKSGSMGKIRISLGGEVVDLFARSNETIERGETILVVHMKDGIADVCTLNKNKKRQQSNKQGV